MCGRMVDIQSAMAEIRRGKKEKEEDENTQDENIMSASAMQGGHSKIRIIYCHCHNAVITQ